MLARDAPGSILAPLIIGIGLTAGAIMTHGLIGGVLNPNASNLLLFVILAPGVALMLYALFLVWFFRDPERQIAAGVVSPADGKVLFVEPIHDDPDIGTGTRIVVFMSPLDVHVNRVPASARLETSTHHDGGYLPAFNKESERNERLTTVWTTTGDNDVPSDQRIKLIQIAGSLARRIVPWTQPSQTRHKGERFGMIKLGSRVDIYLPEGFEAAVQAGDRVKAGADTIAKVRS